MNPITNDNKIIHRYHMNKQKEYLSKNVLHKFHAYRTCHSRVIAHVLFLEHLRYLGF